MKYTTYFGLYILRDKLKLKNCNLVIEVYSEILEDYCKEMVKLCENLMSILSRNLGLQEDILQNAFGGKEEPGGCLRVNYYPKCPQPELTLGLSPHSDPGGLTILLPDEQVAGLQVRGCDDAWITVEPAPHALIVNIGDQIQVNIFFDFFRVININYFLNN